jgi:enamine deaminase RidA (YjgF/YER057c/UK114 family)
MATGTRALTLKLLADVDNFTKNLDKADKDVATFGDKVAKFGKIAGAAFAAAGAAAVAYAGKLAIDGVKSAIEDEAAQAKLANTLKNVTKATDAQIASTEDYILKTSFATGVADDELRPSLDRLTRATKDLDKAQQLQTLALDIAAGSGKSLQAVTESLSKAQEGNLAGLSRLGVGLTKAELATLSFDQITAKLSGTFENQATKQADTFQGKLARLTVAFDEGKETVGAYILDAITPMVEVLVKNVIPAIQDFTSNLGDKLAPVMKVLQPIINGLRSAFSSVRNALAENNDELRPFFNLLKNITDFVVTYMAPAIGQTLGLAFKALGKILEGVIDTFASFVSKITKIYDTITGILNAIKGAGSAVGNFISGASLPSGATSPSTPMAPSAPLQTPSLPRFIAASAGTTNITVNGAIDSESTARQIVTILNDSSARGTLGGNLIYA